MRTALDDIGQLERHALSLGHPHAYCPHSLPNIVRMKFVEHALALLHRHPRIRLVEAPHAARFNASQRFLHLSRITIHRIILLF
jgi:hypothetical protein